MSSYKYIQEQFSEAALLKQSLSQNHEFMDSVCTAAEVCLKAYKRNNKMIFAGNGGSAADAQHLAAELVSRFYFDREPLNAIALTTDTSILTAIGNDYGYSRVFSRQIKACGAKGDIFFAISTSGNSENILEALAEARHREITTIGLSGNGGGKMRDLCDFIIDVPSNSTPRIQEIHIVVGHIICSFLEKEFFVDPRLKPERGT